MGEGTGERGIAGLPLGGATGEVLTKASGDDLDTHWAAGGGGGGGSILTAEVALTNAQIKALGTQAPFEIVATPGPGKFLAFISGLLVIDASAVAYGNIDTTASMAIAYGIGSDNASTTLVGTSALPSVLGGDGELAIVMFSPGSSTPDATQGIIEPFYLDRSQVEDSSLCLAAWNNNAGAYSGGAAGNSGRVKVWYTVEDLP